MRLLIVCQPWREDMYSFFKGCADFTLDLLWYDNREEAAAGSGNHNFEKIYFWSDYKTAEQLLREIRPEKILFFEIIDHLQIATIITANKLGIPTFFIDHGAAGDRESAMKNLDSQSYFSKKLPYLFSRLRSLPRVFFSKYFYYSSAKHLQSKASLWKFLALPLRSLFHTDPVKTLLRTQFQERVPRHNIVFSRENYRQYALQIGEGYDDRVVITGVPYFDRFCRKDVQEGEYIVFIEHPYLEEMFLNWTPAFHRDLANKLFDFATREKRKLFVKLHPRSDRNLWDQYQYDPQWVTILKDVADYTDLMMGSRLIIGYSSSLINGFLCARKNVVNVGWHPEPQMFGPDFSKTGLCHRSMDVADLDTKLDFWMANNLAVINREQYEEFLSNYNYPFDGRATERILDAVRELA